MGLTAFLEKELKVCQQTSIMMGKHKEHVIDPKSNRRNDQSNRELGGDSNRDKIRHRNPTHFSNPEMLYSRYRVARESSACVPIRRGPGSGNMEPSVSDMVDISKATKLI